MRNLELVTGIPSMATFPLALRFDMGRVSVIREKRNHILLAHWQEAAALLFGTVLLPAFLSFGLTPRPSVRLLLWSLLVGAVVTLTLALVQVDGTPSASISEIQRVRRRRRALLRLTIWTGVANVFPLVLLVAVALLCGISVRIHPNSPGVVKSMGALLFLALFVWMGRSVWRRMLRAAQDYRSLAQLRAQPVLQASAEVPGLS